MVRVGVEGSNLMVASLESVVATLVEEVVVDTILVEEAMVVEDLDYMARTSLQLVQARWSHQASLNLSRERVPQQKETCLVASKS
jgi:hypothetical protein